VNAVTPSIARTSPPYRWLSRRRFEDAMPRR
jgi:hypothetical protein